MTTATTAKTHTRVSQFGFISACTSAGRLLASARPLLPDFPCCKSFKNEHHNESNHEPALMTTIPMDNPLQPVANPGQSEASLPLPLRLVAATSSSWPSHARLCHLFVNHSATYPEGQISCPAAAQCGILMSQPHP